VVRSNKARTTKFLSKLLKDTHKTVIDGRSVLPKTAPDITKHKIFLFGFCFFLKTKGKSTFLESSRFGLSLGVAITLK